MGQKNKSLNFKLSGTYLNPNGKPRTTDLSPLLSFDKKFALAIVDALESYCKRYSTHTHFVTLSQILRLMGDFALNKHINILDPMSTYRFFFDFRAYWYTTDRTWQNLLTRNDLWRVFIGFLNYLIDKQILPEFSIPTGNTKLDNRSIIENGIIPLGEPGSQKITDERFECKALVPISLSRNDEQYLDEYETNLIKAFNAFLEAARKEVQQIETEIDEGRRLIENVDYEDLLKKIAESKKGSCYYSEYIHKKNRPAHLFGPNHPNGLANILAWIKNKHSGFYKNPSQRPDHADSALKNMDDFSEIGITQTHIQSYLGLLTSRKAVPLFILLLANNPKFNVESLANAELYGENGIQNLLSTAGEEGGMRRMTIDKPRAGQQKSSILNDEFEKIIDLVIQMTQPYRVYLKKQNDPNYKKLWLATPTPRGYPIPILPLRFRILCRKNIKSVARGINLNKAFNVFLEVARKEVQQIETEIDEGQKLIESVDYEDLLQKVAESKKGSCYYREYIHKKSRAPVHLFGPHHPNGLANILALIKNKHSGFYKIPKKKHDHADPSLKHISNFSKIGIKQAHIQSYLGRLTSRKAVPLFILLFANNPKFNVESLANAELYGENGMQILLSTAGEEGGMRRMTIDKPRAGQQKSSILNDESEKIIDLVIQMTQPYRVYLKKQNDPIYKKLWLASTMPGGYPKQIAPRSFAVEFGAHAISIANGVKKNKYQINGANRSFLMSNDELKFYMKTGASLAKIRVSAGILKWFQTNGSINAAARTLGNTVKISMDHYIPKPLQEAMNHRLLRRYQNLLISAATAGEPYMLEATDLYTTEELHEFLGQMLSKERIKGNDILTYLNKKLKKKTIEGKIEVIDESISDDKMLISVSEDNLAVLFLYQEHLESLYLSKDKLNFPDKSTNTSPKFWTELANALHLHIPESAHQREIQVIYNRALKRIEDLRKKITFPKIAMA